MGRYYSGDIEGKFWFGVQSSLDADFFGRKGQATWVHYYFDKDDSDTLQAKLQICTDKLGLAKDVFDKFFAECDGYNTKMLTSAFKDAGLPGDSAHDQLEWYARYQLGKKIYDCVKEQGYCSFEAEL